MNKSMTEINMEIYDELIKDTTKVVKENLDLPLAEREERVRKLVMRYVLKHLEARDG